MHNPEYPLSELAFLMALPTQSVVSPGPPSVSSLGFIELSRALEILMGPYRFSGPSKDA